MTDNILLEILKTREKSLKEQMRELPFLKSFNFRKDNLTLKKSIDAYEGISIISEIKTASPSRGIIKNDIDILEIVHCMEKAGVVGFSILTEPLYFNGSFLNLKSVVENTSLPCLMKDFVFTEEQFKIAHDLGVTNILIINLLGNTEKMLDLAIKFKLEPVVEIHEQAEIKNLAHFKEIGLNISLIGVNNRNLKTLKVDLNTSKNLIPKIKEIFDEKITIISESGIKTHEDIRFLQSCGADAFLVGTSIMQSKNIEQVILHLRGKY
ncbi:MAG: indole-3-glycerol-phosphate synthase [Promethearchaeota archaeon]